MDNLQQNFFDNDVTQNLTKLSQTMVKIFELTNDLCQNAIQQNWDNCLDISAELNKLLTSYTFQQVQNFNEHEKNLFVNIQRIFTELNERAGTYHKDLQKLLNGFANAAKYKQH